MNILVVGGAGYIGGAVTDCLELFKHKGYDINYAVADNLMYEYEYRKPCKFYKCDVNTDLLSLLRVEDWDAIIWLAALVGDGACQVQDTLAWETNSRAVKVLVDNFNGRICFLSTCSVYGANHNLWLNEETKPIPLSLYAETKLQAEEMLLKHRDAIIFRLGTVYGVSDLFSRLRLDLVVNIMSLKAALNQPLTVFGGDQWRPLIHVRNVANTLVQSVFSPDWRDLIGIYNLAERNYQIREIAETVIKVAPTSIEYTTMPFEDMRNYHVSCEKLHSDLRDNPYSYDLLQGIEELVALFNSNRIKNFNDKRYNNEQWLY